ncbi:MAG: hypothetical protein CMC68_07275, partial [Flavobacteriaceae bacterium]|nr:hypothetical protein [Flavobacteriaceae bacterium]
MTIDNIENTILIGDYYVSESDHLFISGSYLFSDDIEIYSANKPSNKAETGNGQFTINITQGDGYTGQLNQETTNIITLI